MTDFETWWNETGQETLYALNTLTDADAKVLAEIAWESALETANQEPVAVVEITYGREPECYVTGNIDDFPEGIFKLYASPVRTKDLTVSELNAIVEKYYDDEIDLKAMILDGIAADREKNK